MHPMGDSSGVVPLAGDKVKKQERSYLASAVSSININLWNSSRSSTPAPPATPSSVPASEEEKEMEKEKEQDNNDSNRERNREREMPPPPPPPPTSSSQKADDHSVSTLYGQSAKRYPWDCPPLNVMWFHAVDVPKRKPVFLKGKKDGENPNPKAAIPKKFMAFSSDDSRSIESAYQKLLEELEDGRGVYGSDGVSARTGRTGRFNSSRRRRVTDAAVPNTTFEDEGQDQQGLRVPVNEDFLFDVDIEQRELAPVYWLGPVYEVRRGSWFYQEGSTLRPCEENLALQLEEGYLKIKPWTYPPTPRNRSNSGAAVTPKGSRESLRTDGATVATAAAAIKTVIPQQQHQPQTYRLFGTYMNSIATYQDSTTAWLTSDGMLSWVTSTVYQRFAGGGYMSGVKLVRGYTNPDKKDEKRPPTPSADSLSEREISKKDENERKKKLKRRSAPPISVTGSGSADSPAHESVVGKEEKVEELEAATATERQGNKLKRQFSSYIGNSQDPDKQEESIRMRQEQEIQDDYNAQAGEKQGRDIEHVILVTHGVGQLLSLRMESINFVHDVNLFRKTLKGVYSHSPDLRALNSETPEGPGNCRIQVLPVCWRHLLDFPKKREKKGEQDLATTTAHDDELDYPSLEDITIEGVAFARSLISDLALDVLLYQSAYREQIIEIVLKETNRIYKLFKQRNPEFKGKIHIGGHSLGSAIMFDILCRQKQQKPPHSQSQSQSRSHSHSQSQSQSRPHHSNTWPYQQPSTSSHLWVTTPDRPATPTSIPTSIPQDPQELAFDFDVSDFYCLGSPIGLFSMLKGRTISARPPLLPSSPSPPNTANILNPLNPPPPFQDPTYLTSPHDNISSITGHPDSVSSPRVSQMFNIFHPSDPIAYRIEPLISPAMSSLKPQSLPYTKRGIFNAVTPNGLSGIGVKVGQSVSGLWSSISGGIASSILNRSLGLTNEDVERLSAQQSPTLAGPVAQPSPAAGTNAVGGGVVVESGRKVSGGKVGGEGGEEDGSGVNRNVTMGSCGTLIEDNLETLYAKFQKKRVEEHGGQLGAVGTMGTVEKEEIWMKEEMKAQRLRVEEAKVRALNRNGRVDYSIQESALDFNPINTIASHMAYWQDEDVSHFVMSQLLSHRTPSSSSSSPSSSQTTTTKS